MNQAKQGFALLVVLMLLSLMLLLVSNQWYCTFLAREYARERLLTLEHESVLDCFIEYATLLYQENAKTINQRLKHVREEVVDFPAWFSTNKKSYSGTITIVQTKNGPAMTARLHEKGTEVAARTVSLVTT